LNFGEPRPRSLWAAAEGADHPYVKAWWPPGRIIGYEHTFTHVIYDLLRALDEGKVPSPNF
jgi:hypothetical protein